MSPYIRGGAKHTRHSWGEPGEAGSRLEALRDIALEVVKLVGICLNSKMVCYNCKKKQGISSMIVGRNIPLGG